MVADLLANASRRNEEGRFDDGVARLYRAIEALAQLALAERHGITSTDKIGLECIPESLRHDWKPRAENGVLRLGLQDIYSLLDSMGDPLGKTFRDLALHDPERSPLTARNQSILAHGFQPVSEKVFEQLWKAAIKLGEFSDQQLPIFPKFSNSEVF
jgi:CRISPR-associated protein (TIGR02710 family)